MYFVWSWEYFVGCYSCYIYMVSRRQAEVAQGVPGRLRPRIVLTFRHYKGGRSSAKRTGRLYPRRNPWYSLSEAESTSGHMVLSGVPRKKIPSDTTGNRSRDRPTSTPGIYIYIINLVSKEIFSPSNNIHREVGRAKDLSAPLHEARKIV